MTGEMGHIYENFKEWAVRQFGVKDLVSDDEADVPVNFKKAKDLTFERNNDGEFILPKFSEFKTIRQKQRVVRGYIGAVYRFFHSIVLCLSDSNDRRLYWEFNSFISLQSGCKR